jgi:phosphatidylglycerol:prolipoprotein diacylglycerol transferase
MFPILYTIPKIGSFGPYSIHTFGLVMVIAFLAALWLAKQRAPRFGVDPTKVMDAGFWCLVFGILGARVAFIAQDWGFYSHNPNELFSLQFAGLTSFGGLIFGGVTLAIWARRHRLPVLRMLDLLAPSFLIGHIIGRFGCLMNGCCYGGLCDVHAFLATKFVDVPGFHQPAQIYDAAMNAVGLGILFFLERRGLRMGQALGFAVTSYGVCRFIYEFWRAGSVAEVKAGLASSTTIGTLPITEGHVMALVLIVTGVAWVVLTRRNQPEMAAMVTAPEQELQPA